MASGSSISSQSSIEKVREELTCSVCLEQFREPKMLPCFHTFCKECLEKTKQSFRGNLLCPTCRTKTSVTEHEMIQKLPNNFIVNRVLDALGAENSGELKCGSCNEIREPKWRCFDCKLFFCGLCYKAHGKKFPDHRMIPMEPEGDVFPARDPNLGPNLKSFCINHKEKELDLYCRDCQICVCTICFATAHQGHHLQNVELAMEEGKAKIKKQLLESQNRAELIGEARGVLEYKQDKFEKRFQDCKQQINKTLSQVIKAVSQKAEEMIEQLEKAHKTRQKALDCQQEDLRLQELKLNGAQTFAEQIIASSSGVEVLSSQKQVTEKLKDLNTSNGLGFIDKVNDFFEVHFDVSDALECISNARVEESSISPGETQLALKNTPVEGKPVVLTIATSSEGYVCFNPADRVIKVQITNPSNIDTRLDAKPKEIDYEAVFTPTEPGFYDIDVYIWDRKAWALPKKIFVSRNYMDTHQVQFGFGTHGTGCGQFQGPLGVAVDGAKYAVADSGNGRIQCCHHDGGFFAEVGVDDKPGVVFFPRALAYSRIGELAVIDSTNSQVHVYGCFGELARSFGKVGREIGEFYYPSGISVDEKNRFIIADSGNNRIQVLNSVGDFLLVFGSSGPEKLKSPESAIFTKDHFIVADTGNNVLKVFSADGSYKETIKLLNGEEFQSPCHVTSDPNGFLVICERGSHRLKVLSPDMNLITVLGMAGRLPGQLFYPECSVVTSDGAIAVADYGNNRIQVFF
ncbi:RING finger protein nhl-1 [Nematostella vectensis]|uniref:RING finger protein nhl-1 n=1 Tax=Nematostella vectensis TaxID=45351 RepID=UPI0013905186|nr:RING finger protein nhl-1 [Nematostella vectensis]